jgi:hypothetical protein
MHGRQYKTYFNNSMLSCIGVEFSFDEDNTIETQLYIDDVLYSKNHDADI